MIKLTEEQAEVVVNVMSNKMVIKNLGPVGLSVLEEVRTQLEGAETPHYFKNYTRDELILIAKRYKASGYSVRKIAKKMGYKGHRSVQVLLNEKSPDIIEVPVETKIMNSAKRSDYQIAFASIAACVVFIILLLLYKYLT